MKTIPPIWIINLEKDIARRNYMEQHLQELGLSYEIIPAINGENLSPELLSFYSPFMAKIRTGRELTKGEIGCALTHARLWERMEKENLSEVVILEDDVKLEQEFVRCLENFNHFPSFVEFVNFTSPVQQKPFGKPIFDDYYPTLLLDVSLLLSCYLLTARGVKKLLYHVYPLVLPADELTGRAYITGMVSVGVFPKVAQTGIFDSSLENIGIARKYTNRELRYLKYKDKFKKLMIALKLEALVIKFIRFRRKKHIIMRQLK